MLQRHVTVLSAQVEADLAADADDRWDGSPFAWMLPLPPARKARAARELVEHLVASFGYGVNVGTGANHDLSIRSRSADLTGAVCLSTLWSGGKFTFQSLRPGTDIVVLLGLCPDRVRAWVVPSTVVFDAVDVDGGRGWLAFPVADPPGWLDGFGGTLDLFEAALTTVCGPPLLELSPA